MTSGRSPRPGAADSGEGRTAVLRFAGILRRVCVGGGSCPTDGGDGGLGSDRPLSCDLTHSSITYKEKREKE